MKATFENTVSILVQSYLKGTLERGNCCACAVGNLVAHACGFKFVPASGKLGLLNTAWENGEYPSRDYSGGWAEILSTEKISKKAKGQIHSTGYTVNEISQIEFAFERGSDDIETDDRIFFGLMAVVDVLAEIHGISLEQKTEAKAMFVKENL